jgi:hypothetical protein
MLPAFTGPVVERRVCRAQGLGEFEQNEANVSQELEMIYFGTHRSRHSMTNSLAVDLRCLKGSEAGEKKRPFANHLSD